MLRPTIEPITDSTIAEFAYFLHLNLQQSRSAAEWEAALRVDWRGERPNYGFAIRDEGRIVGGIGAYYKDRLIRGQIEKICNITSWCVLSTYRQQSMRLVMAVISQAGYHFTDFSPTKVVSATLQFFKFRPLDERQAVILNLPWNLLGNIQVLYRAADIEGALENDALQIYKDHAGFSWLHHVLVGKPGEWCHIIYKRRILKGMRAAAIYYVSDKERLEKYFYRLSTHLFFRGCVVTLVECRLLKKNPWPSVVRSGFNPRLYLSSTLKEDDIDYLYSESMALDL